MTITTVFNPPLPSDSPAVFNTKAFQTLGDLNHWSTEANTLAGQVNTAAANAASSASTASTAATTATSAATTATTKAGEASTSATTATSAASTATTKAGEASTSATAAAASAAEAAATVTGKVTGPASATANALAKFDGTTGKLVKVSGLVEDAAGNVGVGAASPAAKLHVAGATFRHTDATGSYGYTISTATNTTTLATLFGGSSFAIQTGGSGSNQLTLDSTGNFATGGSPQPNIRNTLWGASTTSATHSLVCYNSNGFARFAARDDGRVAMGVNDALIVDENGNLLAGPASGSFHRFSKNNPGSAAFAVDQLSSSAGSQCLALGMGTNGDATGYFIRCADFGAYRFQVLGNGNVQNANNSYGAISDLKLKENIVDVTPKLAKLLQVRIVNYTLKADPNKTKLMGVIAQELEQISSGLIEETPDFEEVTRTREVAKTVPVTEQAPVLREQKTVEVVDGKAIVKTQWMEELADVPVVDHYPMFDDAGQPVLEMVTPEVPAVTDADGNVTQPAVAATYRQAMHSVPRMQQVTETETYTERVPTGTTTKSVKYSVFVPMLIKAMQEQQAQIDTLSGRLLALGAA